MGVNWKVGMQRPTVKQATAAVVGDSLSDVVFVYEMEVPDGFSDSAAKLVCANGADYEILAEKWESHKKYYTVISVLVRKGCKDFIQSHNERVSQSPKRAHKACHAQRITTASGGEHPGIWLCGINMDPHEEEFQAQLNQL